jgi:hypothetical protein
VGTQIECRFWDQTLFEHLFSQLDTLVPSDPKARLGPEKIH